MKHIILPITLTLFFLKANAQLYINEVSQGASGSKEYIEFVVAGTRTCTDSTMDLRGVMFDDNAGWYGTSAFNGGCMRFANNSNWAAVPYGSIILVYNAADKNASITQSDDATDANHDYVYIVSSGSSYLEVNTSQPSSVNSSYDYSSAVSGSWSSASASSYGGVMALGNGTDVVSVINPNSSTTSAVHSVGWGSLCSGGTQSPVIKFSSVTSSGVVLYHTGSSPTSQSSWTNGSATTSSNAETPGAGNTTANTSWINAMRVPASSTGPATPGSISGPVTICAGASGTYSVSAVSGATSYTWTLPSGWTGSSSTNTISVTAGSTGGTISVTASNSCGTSTASTLTVTVNPVVTPSVSIASSPSGAICASSSVTFTATPANGGTAPTYAWYRNGTPVGTGSTYTASSWSNGDQVYAVMTSSASCVSAATAQSNTITLTVTPVPSAPASISGLDTVCAGTSQTYSISGVTNATSYTWSFPTGWTGSSNTTSLTATVGTNSGAVSVTASNACGTSSAASLMVTVRSIPATPGSISGNISICAGSTQTYSITAIAGAASYSWSVPTGWTINSGANTNTISVTANSNSGNISATASNACGTSATSTSLYVTVNPNLTPSVTISANPGNTICTGTSVTFTATPTNGGATPSYQWKKNGVNVGANQATYTDNALANGDQISVTLTSSAACVTASSAGSSTITMTVIPTPATPGSIAGNITICPSTTNTYSVSPVSGATSYIWTLPAGWTGTSTTTSISAAAGTTGGTVQVAAQNSCGTSSASTLIVTVNPTTTPSVTIASSAVNNTICAGSPVTFTATPVNGGTAPGYQWYLNGTIIAGATGSTFTTSTLFNNDVISVIMTSSLSCSIPAAATSNAITTTVISIPSFTSAISGNTVVCAGTAQSYSIPAVSGATGYNWTLPSGWTGSSTGNSISTTAGTAGGNISVSASNSCGTSAAQTIAVTVNTIPAQPGAISGPASACAGTTPGYSVSAVSGATTYNWTLPAGWTGTSSSASISPVVGSSAGTISVAASNACGSSSASTLYVAVVAAPPAPAAISGNTAVCIGSTQTYSVSSTGGYSYIWSAPSGWTGSSTSDSITYTAGASGTISVKASGVCGLSPATALNVISGTYVTPSVSASTAKTTICAGAQTIFTANPVNGGTNPQYQWLVNGTVAGVTGPSFSTAALNTGDSVSVILTSNAACVTANNIESNRIKLTVLPSVIPGINVNAFPGFASCSGTNVTFVSNITAGGTTPAYEWYRNGQRIPGASGSSYTINKLNDGDTITAVLISSEACPTVAAMPSNKVGVKIYPVVVPSIAITSNPAAPITPGIPVTFTASYTGGGATPDLQWLKNGQAIPFETNNTYTASNLKNGDVISIQMISYDRCPSPALVTSNEITVGNLSTGIGTAAGNWQGTVRLYPNPSSGHFTIDVDWGNGHNGERVLIDMINVVGQSVYSTELQPDRAHWSLNVWLNEGIANGVYQLRLRTRDMQTATQVLIAR